MVDRLRNYILEKDFRMIILDGKIDILNYIEIDHFDDNKIIVRHEKGLVIIKGYKLIITKMLDDEILINGIIENIELR